MKRIMASILSALMLLPLFGMIPTGAEKSEIPEATLTYYVSEGGKADADGSEKNPFASIEAARDAIRELKNTEGLPNGGINVVVKNGTYNVMSGIEFTAEDSGTADCPITYVSKELHGARLTSETELDYSDFEKLNAAESDRLIDKSAADKVLKIDLTKYGAEKGTLPAPNTDYRLDFVVDGVQQLYAEYPNREYFRAPSSFEDAYNTKIAMTDESIERMKQWDELTKAYLYVFTSYEWSVSICNIYSLDEAAKGLNVSHCGYGLGARSRYRFINVFEEIDRPGEYYLDIENSVLYAYLPENTGSYSHISANLTDSRIINATDTEYVTFSGFDVSGSRAEGIHLENCRNVTLDNLKIYAIGDIGINARGYDITIQNCDISGTGADAIRIYGGDRVTLTPSNNVIYNNYIHDWATRGLTYRPGVRADGVGITISHNEFANSNHFAIHYFGNDIIMEYNYIHDVVTDTGDAGAIYAGRHYTYYGNVIRYNYFEDIGNPNIGMAMAIYWDDGLSGQTAYGNIINRVYGKRSYAVMIGGGRDNILTNNIFIDIYDDAAFSDAISVDTRARAGYFDPTYWSGDPYGHIWQFEEVPYNTGVWAEKYPDLAKVKYVKESLDSDDDEYAFFNPCFWDISNNAMYVSGNGPKVLQLGFTGEFYEIPDNINNTLTVENNFLVGKNLSDFVDAENGNFNLKADASIYSKIKDFETIPFDEIGRILPPEMNFKDVTLKKWFYDAVKYVFDKGLMTGKTEDTFAPNENMTRAQLVTVLYRMESEPAVSTKTPFKDLKQAWYRDAVAWAYENSIVNGKSETSFDPLGNVTREQMAAILYRYCEYKGFSVENTAELTVFPDASKVSSYAKAPMKWAYAEGIITGKAAGNDNILAPKGNATRAEVATILMRFCEKY